MSRILYECRDLTFPAGGVRRLYRHVEILNKHGMDARILHHTPGYTTEWFKTQVPVDYWTPDYKFGPDDILVIPEGHVDVMRRSMSLPCKRVVIALNWGNIFRGLKVGEDWRSFGITHIIAGSHYEAQFILSSMGLSSTVIVSGIDTELFAPAPSKLCSITYMPRKNTEYFHQIAAVFRSKFPEYEAVTFVSIEMQAHSVVAEMFATSAIFLAHTFPEGLSRKTLEAMACGNLVVGFAGHGSLECMDHLVNCYLADDGDILTAVELLDLAIRQFSTGQAKNMQRAAIETAARYSLNREENTVFEYWSRFTASTSEGEASLGEREATTQHGPAGPKDSKIATR